MSSVANAVHPEGSSGSCWGWTLAHTQYYMVLLISFEFLCILHATILIVLQYLEYEHLGSSPGRPTQVANFFQP